MLSTNGFSVFLADNGQSGLAMLKARRYLAVFTDIQVPQPLTSTHGGTRRHGSPAHRARRTRPAFVDYNLYS